MLLSQHYHERSEDTPHPHSLEQLARIWRNGENGTITFTHTQQKIIIRNGGVIDLDAPNILKQALFKEPFAFTPSKEKGFGDWISIGDILWATVIKTTIPGFLRNRKHLQLKEFKNANRAEDYLSPLVFEVINFMIDNIISYEKRRIHICNWTGGFSVETKTSETVFF